MMLLKMMMMVMLARAALIGRREQCYLLSLGVTKMWSHRLA